jgi:hypothetical protein
MGSQGMKRKGRKHLPKTGTHQDDEYLLERSRQDVVNFGRHRDYRGPGRALVIALAIAAVVCLVAFFALT